MKKFNNVLGAILGGIGVLFICGMLDDLGYREISIGFAIAAMILLAVMPNYKELKKDRAIKQGGVEGENRVKEELKELKGKGFKVVNGVYLKGDTLTQEIDSLVVTPKGIFNIETKNYGGSISINKYGDWIRTKQGKTSYLKNPMDQVERHKKCIKEIVGNVRIIDVVVIANSKTTIEGTKNSKVKVIKYSGLSEYISSYKGENKYNVDEVYSLIKSRIKGESNIKSYKDKNEVPFYKEWDFLARLGVAAFFIGYVIMGL
ncbi:MAG: nuclease-related domain-containing protein [Clostridium sp.]